MPDLREAIITSHHTTALLYGALSVMLIASQPGCGFTGGAAPDEDDSPDMALPEAPYSPDALPAELAMLPARPEAKGCAPLPDISSGGVLEAESCWRVMDLFATVLSGELVVEPGVTLYFSPGATLMAGEGAVVRMKGEEARPIALLSLIADQGHSGVVLGGPVTHQLEHVVIRGVKTRSPVFDEAVALYVAQQASVTLDHVLIADNSEARAVVFEGEKSRATHLTIARNKSGGDLHIDVAATLDATSTFEGNTRPASLFGSATVPGVLRALGEPWHVPKAVKLDAPLEVEAGVELVMAQSSLLQVNSAGSLKLSGEEGAPVMIRGEEARRGFWKGVQVSAIDEQNRFTHAQISDAGSEAWNGDGAQLAALALYDGSVALDHVRFERNAGHALLVDLESSIDRFDAVSLVDNAHLSYIGARHLDQLSPPALVEGNDVPGFEFGQNGTEPALDHAVTVPALGVPYLVHKGMTTDSQLTLEAGVELQFAEDTSLTVRDDALLTIAGTEENPVIMRGWEDREGYWMGIDLRSKTHNALSHLALRHAGSRAFTGDSDHRAALFIRGNAALSHLRFEQNAYRDLFVGEGAVVSCEALSGDALRANDAAQDRCGITP